MPAQPRRTAENFLPSAANSGPSSSGLAFQTHPRGNIDDIAEESAPLRRLEQVIEDDKQLDVVDKSAFSPGTQTGKTPTPPKVTTSDTNVAKEPSNAFTKCWSTISTIDIPAVKHGIKSWYIPCAISLFEILSNMDMILNGNEELRWISPSYFSLPVRVYYSVLFYVQVLRAKEQAGTLSNSEGSFIRAFFRRFKDTSCPIAGPLLPIFHNIVSVLPDDDQFDYVYPTIPRTGTYHTTVTGASTTQERITVVNSTHLLFPSVPLVAALLRYFCHLPSLESKHFDDMGWFVPFKISAGNGTIPFASVVFPAHTDGSDNPVFSKLLSNPALAHPLCESKNRLKEVHSFWKQSSARLIPEITSTQTFSPITASEQTLMSEDFDWFEPCIHMAQVQAKFFEHSTNLSHVPTVGGMSALVVANLSFPDKPSLPTKINEWFPNLFSRVDGEFSATCGRLPIEHKYQAIFAFTNAILAWKDDNGEPIGSLESNGKFGPYFENNKVTFKSAIQERILRNIFTTLQIQFYHARGV